jgi:hypothetical protein
MTFKISSLRISSDHQQRTRRWLRSRKRWQTTTTILLIAAALTADGCAGPAPKQAEVPVKDCQVGDLCELRAPRKSALVFTNLRTSTRYCKAQAALNGETPNLDMKVFDHATGTGDSAALFVGAQIRLTKPVEGCGAEAVVVKDNYRPSPDGIGYVGVKLAGRSIWLQNLGAWQAETGR